MEYAILRRYEEVAGYVSKVSAAADKNKDAFGFLSSSAYEEMASKGQLWIAVNEKKELKGYLIFGGTMPALKIFQVYACKSARGHEIGKKLIDAVKEFARNNNYHSITARVAADLPANRFWEKHGFLVHRQVKGGETKKRTINMRGYSLSDNDLFGRLGKEENGLQPNGPVLDRPVYALDLNLLLDVFKDREGYEKVVKIMQIGFQGGFTICITPEFKKELERQSASFSDDPVLRLAGAFPEINTSLDISGATESLRKIVFPDRTVTRKSTKNDESDLMHLAYCISAGVDGFVTREKALLRACNEIKSTHGVAILSPDEIVLGDDEFHKTSALLNTNFSLSFAPVTEEIKNFLRDQFAADAIFNLLAPTSRINAPARVYEARLDGDLFGVYFSQPPRKVTSSAVAGLYIDEGSPQAIAAIDHFLEISLRSKAKFPYRLNIYIGRGQDLTKETLTKKGFLWAGDHFIKIISDQFLSGKNWTQFSKSIKSFCGISMPEKFPSKKELQNTGVCLTDFNGRAEIFSWFDFETMISPRFILTSDRSCTLVPIQEKYANGLIGDTKNQLSLLSSSVESLLLEKAYFRSPTKALIFKKGGIVSFYVSGSKSIQELIGFARITHSVVVSVDEAVIRYDRQGVLSQHELSNVADASGMIHVFTFDNFLEFDKRVSFSKAKSVGLISGANLVSPESIPFSKFKALIELAFYD